VLEKAFHLISAVEVGTPGSSSFILEHLGCEKVEEMPSCYFVDGFIVDDTTNPFEHNL
jgi:hypothetical protein